MGAVVVGVDGSDVALDAVRWAAREAADRHAELTLVYAFDVAGLYADGAVAPLLDDVEEQLRVEGDEVLVAARAAAAEAAPGVASQVRTDRGAPSMVLIEESRKASLLVLGSAGRGALGTALGSVTLAVAAHAESPVVVVRGTVHDGPVLVGVDGGPLSDGALAHAFAVASAHGAGLTAFYAWHDGRSPALRAAGAFDRLRDAEERALAERLAGWSGRYPDVAVERVIERSEPGRALVEHSERSRLVVVATRGRGGFTGLLLGSTGLSLIQRAGCPVMLVGPRAHTAP
ncbi:universal stress protein [Pseudonocardia parietis]|uniref:Nucleotide-binding universal stress UspA family protein n=1 Tax=Pseudonocardia parietis TaxID=570936 RepID=A0ABS4VRK1_9PSEU|nr:universal stress protein [Pseudonocardia parietis]MBP2366401.1 nucleotide-binding universal stress UspA family protein [Pseudonocardia parietis]